MINAIGTVQNTVKVPQGLPFSACTTTSASTARTMMQISKDADAGDRAGDRSHLRAHHVAERASVAPRGQEQHGHVLHRAGEDDAGENPQRARQVAHLRREHRTDQRAGAGDRREVMAEQHVTVGRNVIEAVIVTDGRRRPAGIDAEHFVGDEQRVDSGRR